MTGCPYMEPTDAQFLIINALEMLEVLIQQTFDPETNNWYILTLSEDLPMAMIVPSGKVVGVNLPANTSTIQNPQSLVLDGSKSLMQNR